MADLMPNDNDTLTPTQRRTLIAMWCRVAWADGVLHSVELDVIVNIFERIGAGSLTAEEFETWIFAPPPLEEEVLPSQLKRLFVHEALQIAAADGEVEHRELNVIRDLLHRCFPEALETQGAPELQGDPSPTGGNA